MKTYVKEIIVGKEDLDDLQRVNNVRYVQWVQDVAQEHWEHTTTESMRKEMVWVLLKHTIHYKNAAVLGDAIRLTTFVKENRGALCTRVVEMFNAKSEQPIVLSKTEWCLLNAKSLKPIRISDEIKNMFVKNI